LPETQAFELAEMCQRLARIARQTMVGPSKKHPCDIEQVSDLVRRAIELLEGSKPPAEIQVGGFLIGQLGRNAETIAERMIESLSRARPIPANEPPSPIHRLALRGYESGVDLPDLIGFLSSIKIDGRLEIHGATEVFQLELEGGDVVHAESDQAPLGQRLGDLLEQQGAITRQLLEATRRRIPGRRLGEVLLEEQLVTRAQLRDALQSQIELLFQRLFETKLKEFLFWIGPPMHAESKLRLNATSLLLGGARAVDERNRGSQDLPQHGEPLIPSSSEAPPTRGPHTRPS
jgi:hypothetical protein